MRAAALAGRLGPRRAGEDWEPRLAAALSPDGAAATAASGALAAAWTPAEPDSGEPVLCVLGGRPRVKRLAGELAARGSGGGGAAAVSAERLIGLGYEAFGERVLDLVDGEFALLLWDRRAGRGLLARDRLGLRPLFVTEHGGALLFASEIRNLLALLPARPAPDGAAVAHYLARTSPRFDRTLFEGVRRLPPAHALRLSGAGWRRRRYWSPRYAAPDALTDEAAAERVRSGVDAAVGRALDGARRPAVMLSGGFDSSTVAASARSLRADAGVTAYSVVFPEDPAVDESARVASAREWVGLPAVEAAFVTGSPLSAGIEFLVEWQVPSVTPNLFIWLPLLRRAAKDGVDVMLDGEGGDELFGCALYLVADRVRAGRPLAAVRTARRVPGMGPRPRPRWLRRALVRYGLRGAVPYRLHEPVRRALRRDSVPAWLSDSAREERRAGDDPWAWKRLRGPRWWAQLADALTDRVDALGAADQLRREGALAGLQLRHPLRDPELVDLVLALPPEPAFDPDVDRALARRAMAGALPPEILGDDAKPVFNSILGGGLRGRDDRALRELLADPHPELARRVRADALAALPAGDPRAPTWGVDLWRLASLELWLEQQSDPGALERVAAALDRAPAVAFTVVT